MLERLRREVHNIFRHSEHSEHPLNYLFWECTQRCNLNCLHCGSDCISSSQYPDMPREDIWTVLDQINQHSHDHITVVITGGEPLLRKDLEICGLGIRKRGFRWSIVTNGYLYNRARHISLLNAGMGAITVSFDGMQDTHNWLRNNPRSYDRALAAIELISQSDRLASDVVTCVNKRNLHQLEEIYNILVSNGARSWRLFTIAPIGRAATGQDMQLDGNELRLLMDFISNCRKQKGAMEVKFSCEGYVGTYEPKVRDNLFFCRAGINIASVLIDGSIGACPNVNRQFVQGSIYTDDFMDVWNNRYNLYRNRSWTRTGQCAQCNQYKYCKGNGLHYWPADKSNVLSCHYSKLHHY